MFRLSDFRFLVPELRRERRAYLIGAGLIVCTSLFLVANPWFIGQAVSALESGIREDLVVYFALGLVGAVLIRGLTQFWMRQIVIGASRRIEYRLRNSLFRHLERLDGAYFARYHTGDIMSRFTSDIDAVRMTIGPGVMYLVNTIFTFIFAMIFMLSVSPTLTLWSLVPLLLLTVVIRFLGPRVHSESMAAQERLAEISVHAQENFSNSRVVKAFVREEPEIARMRGHSDRYFEQNMRLARLRAATHGLLWLMGDLLVLVLLGIGGYELLNGTLGLGEFAAFKSCQLILVWPMIALGWVMTLFQRGAASAQRVRDILEAQPRIDDSAAVEGRKVTEGRVEFDRVSFRHDEQERWALEDVSFTLEPGQTLGIVGPTGCGKSTLLSLVPRLAAVTEGRIVVDRHPVESFPLTELRREIATVPQEAFLFSTTIAGNIAFGRPDATMEAIQEAAHLVGIHDEIVEFPRGYEQRVGERGITLSGGQKQRIALARALLTEPRILLLDDVLSAVDASTEAHILEGLERSTLQQTVLIASHRLSAVRQADQIIVLDEGKIVQRGTHDELMARDGYYRHLFRKQTIEAELEDL